MRDSEVQLGHWGAKLAEIRKVHTEEMREQNKIARSFMTPAAAAPAADDNAMDVVEDENTVESSITPSNGTFDRVNSYNF